ELLGRLLPRVRHIITVSQYSKRRIADSFGLPDDRISVVLNGVNEAFHPYPPEACAAVIRDLGLPTSRYVLAQATGARISTGSSKRGRRWHRRFRTIYGLS